MSAHSQAQDQTLAQGNATFGELLAAADLRFARDGGYRADAWCEANRVDLVFRDEAGIEAVVDSADWPEGLAPEDSAHALLAARIGAVAAEAHYFVVTLR